MKRLIYISILVLAAQMGYAQGLYQLGTGNDLGQVQVATGHDDAIYIIEVTGDANYQLQSWDGFVYTNHGEINALPKHGINTNGIFGVIDALWHNDKLYVAGQYDDSYTGTTPNIILEWDGSTWKNLTNQEVTGAYSLTEFVEHGSDFYIAGIFRNSSLLSLDNDSWTPVGGVLTTDKNIDYITDVEVFQGKIYATGQFTQPFTGAPFNLGVYANGSWAPISTPPFIHTSSNFEVINNELLLTGVANVQFDYVKSFSGTGNGWDNVSSGLENVEALEFWDMAGNSDLLCITGVFEDLSKGRRFNFLLRDKNGWKFGENDFVEEHISLCNMGAEIYAYGDFTFKNVSNIGEVTNNRAMLAGKLYLDENENCIQDETETGLAMTRLILNPGNHSFFTNADGSYEIPVGKGAYTLTFDPQDRHKFGCGRVASVTVDKFVNYSLPELTAVEIPNVVDLELKSHMSNGWNFVKGAYNDITLLAVNNGTTRIEGATLTMKMGDWWDDLNIVPAPISSDDYTYVWDVTDLEKDQVFEIKISGTIKADIGLYNDFCFTGEVDHPQYDVDADDNRETAEFKSIGKMQPITKQCSAGDWYDPSISNIEYQIRFANTSDQIINKIKVRDTFDADMVVTYALDLTDLGSSMKIDIKNLQMSDDEWRLVYTWSSTNAAIAPRGSANNADVGYAQIEFDLHDYSKKEGTQLCNYAQVFFENQEPISTNTVCSESKNVGIDPVVRPSLVNLYPNPAQDYVTVKNNSFENRNIEVYTQMGQMIFKTEVGALSEGQVDVSRLTTGIYLVKIVGFETQKLVVQ